MSIEDNGAPAPSQVTSAPDHGVSNFDKLMGGAARLLRHQQDRLTQAENDYNSQRTELENRYRLMAAQLVRDSEQQMELLDRAHAANVAELQRTITSLKGLNGRG